LDGGQHNDQADYDERRTKTLEACGWRVIRFWNSDVVDNADGVADTRLAGAVTPHLPTPFGRGPLPLPVGEVHCAKPRQAAFLSKFD
jgi:hypothetical protein